MNTKASHDSSAMENETAESLPPPVGTYRRHSYLIDSDTDEKNARLRRRPLQKHYSPPRK
jgi:hypothetical protein